MESKEYSIIRRVREVPDIPTQTLKAPDLEKIFSHRSSDQYGQYAD